VIPPDLPVAKYHAQLSPAKAITPNAYRIHLDCRLETSFQRFSRSVLKQPVSGSFAPSPGLLSLEIDRKKASKFKLATPLQIAR